MKNKKIKENKAKIGLKPYLKRYKIQIILYILIYAIASACDILQTILFADIIEKITFNLYLDAIYSLLFVIGVVIIKRLGWYLSNRIYYKYTNKIMSELNFDLARQAFKLNSKTYSDNDIGTFVQRIVADPERIVTNLSDVIITLMDMVSALVIIIYITTLNVYVSLILIGLILVCALFEIKRVKVFKKNRVDTRKKNDKINSLTTEIVRSEKDIKSLGLEQKLEEVSKENYDSYKKASYKLSMTDCNFWSFRNTLIEIVTIGVLILGVYFMDLGTMTMAAFMIVYSNRGYIYDLVWSAGNISSKFAEIRVCKDRMFALFDDDRFATEHFGNVHLDKLKGEIEFKNVSYSYVEYEEEKEEENKKRKKRDKNTKKQRKIASTNQIFKDLSFKIKPNTTVAFVGRSGSGKSTILNLMSKMYVVDSGEVLIDGVNINGLDKETLRNGISLVNQFPYIFDMTIKENMSLAKADATEEEMEDALKKASLWEFVSSLPKGINTRVGEGGIKLSGGQKQRLAIARALLRNSAIIIFDESTSSLDNFAQEDIKKSIDALKGESTIIIVAHRLSTIRNSDVIYFLDQGKVLDVGTFQELFDRNELFRNMFVAENLT